MAYNHDNCHCDYCGDFHYKGQLIYLGRIPGRGHVFICSGCKSRRDAIQASKKIKKERQKLRDSQPKLF
jgi:hypothetical protein